MSGRINKPRHLFYFSLLYYNMSNFSRIFNYQVIINIIFFSTMTDLQMNSSTSLFRIRFVELNLLQQDFYLFVMLILKSLRLLPVPLFLRVKDRGFLFH